MATLHTDLPRRRAQAGLSQTALAERVGISRQALSAIESGRSTPSTLVALRLAAALGCSVEALFSVEGPALPDLHLPELAGRRVVLGHIDGRWVAHALEPGSTEPADGVVDAQGRVQPTVDPSEAQSSALIAGCAPTLGVGVGLLARQEPARWLQLPSGRSLELLRQGRVHVAGLHLADLDAPSTHDALVSERLGHAHILPLVGWREGLALPPGSPIRGVQDLLDPGIQVALRPAGSGAARVLERALRAQGMDPTQLQGPACATHMDATVAVRHGLAHAAVVVEPVARALGLEFVPLAEERFELVVSAQGLQHPGVRRLLDTLQSLPYRRQVQAMGAYQLQGLGPMRTVAA